MADATPTATAVRGPDRTVTYAELWHEAAALADRLRGYGVRRDEPVAVCLERSVDCVVAAIAVLAAGGAYLMLDVRQPTAWTGRLLADSAARFVVSRAALWAELADPAGRADPAWPPPDLTIVPIDVATQPDVPAQVPRQSPAGDTLAYVSYTSGSSGTPKGVLIEHGGLANLVDWYLDRYRIGPGDHLTQLARPSFDAFALEVWPCLSAGATLHIVEPAMLDSPADLRDWLYRTGITVAFLPTPLAEQVLELRWPTGGCLRLRDLLVGGDRLAAHPATTVPFRVHNLYGPTEGTVVATCCEVPGGAPGSPPIGRPIPGMRAHVLDEARRPVPDGEPGELHLGGVGVARGYLNSTGEQGDRFWPEPGEAGARAYATGDLVRRAADGQLHFLGRVDDQLQVRGFRVEPAEIESVLRAHPAVRRAAVVARTQGAATAAQLAAFVVAPGGVEPAELRRYLAARLPDYLVPALIVPLDELPWTARGKIDRRALAERPVAGTAAPAADDPAENPALALLERLLMEAWGEVLGMTGIGPHDSFFEIGGDSLGVMRLVGRFRRAGVILRPEDVYAHPVLRDLARVLHERPSPDLVASANGTVPTA